MNLTEDRAAIAAAASTVPVVTCKPRYWQISRPGQALVRLSNLTRDTTGFGFIATWQVMVALSQETEAAEAWIADQADDLIGALSAELVITRLEPVELVLDTGKVPALQITGTRAA